MKSMLSPRWTYCRPISRWKRLRKQQDEAEAAAKEASRRLRDFEKNYLATHPLAQHQIDALVDCVRAGDKAPLCCEAGYERLAKLVDPIWAHWLNTWAYEALGCARGFDHIVPEEERVGKLLGFLDDPAEWLSY